MAAKGNPVDFRIMQGICKVVPGQIHVKSRETVTFRNCTDEEVRIFFGKEALFGIQWERVKPNESLSLEVKPQPPTKPTVFHYAVFCDQTDGFGEGSGNPRIILDP